RTMGNSVLQSGASIGAILTPLVMRAMMTDVPGGWRLAFQVIGASGVIWVVLWFASIRLRDLRPNESEQISLPAHVNPSAKAEARRAVVPVTPWSAILSRRFFLLLFLLFCIHTTWQLLRVWLPMFLQKGRGYSESAALLFNSAYFVATDVGCIAAGAVS